ncbi:MAG TPA: dihydroxyacetone kinase phosphoryl donor subunit DhaM [Actinotalea sp.]
MRVALVLVSHSAPAAGGTADIARQMAPDVTVVPAGGIEADGGDDLGTSADRVLAAVQAGLVQAEGVVILTDLGSAILTTDTVLELLDMEDDGSAERVRVPSAPFVEGAVAAAVEAQQGGDLDAVEAAAVRAGSLFAAAAAAETASDGAPDAAAGVDGPPALTAHVVLRNPLGLHARPAALLARAVADSGATVRVDGANGASVLELMQLGAVGGRDLTVVASGEGAQAALDLVVSMLEGGFGEV